MMILKSVVITLLALAVCAGGTVLILWACEMEVTSQLIERIMPYVILGYLISYLVALEAKMDRSR